MAETKPFRIGLCMAGAVSAGAYTAGVMDFLLEALDAWEAAKQRCRGAGLPPADWPVPPHEVSLEGMSGTSAGAMTTALTAIGLCSDFPVVRALPARSGLATGNPFYDSWVCKIDIDALLGLRDLADKSAAIASVLDGSVLAEIARQALRFEPRAARRRYVAPSLPFYLYVTNLGGIPYAIRFSGGPAHEMAMHSDHVAFRLDQAGAGGADFKFGRKLPADSPDDPQWAHLVDAALASGAFPIGLPARVVTATPEVYEERGWTVPFVHAHDPNSGIVELRSERLKPNWRAHRPDRPFKFANADGGFLNNEPFEIVRQELAGGPGKRNPREADAAGAAVVMIDPFPDPVPFDPKVDDDSPATDLFSVLAGLITAAKNQGRFKPELLYLQSEEKTFSRFLIAPAAEPRDGKDETLASGACAAFAGFFDESLRRHDFMLGRRNCQRFLQRHFVLAPENPVFSRDWVAARGEAWMLDQGGEGRFLPIIPLMRGEGRQGGVDLNAEVALPARPALSAARLHDLQQRFHVRADHLFERALAGLGLGWLGRQAARTAWKLVGRKRVMEGVEGWVVEGLRKQSVLGDGH